MKPFLEGGLIDMLQVSPIVLKYGVEASLNPNHE